MRALVTGANGFIAGYLVAELLERGYEVVGIDNFSKYGRVEKSYNSHPRYKLVEGDAKDVNLVKSCLAGCNHFVAGAAMIGGIRYFHKYAYDLLAENERITASAFDAAISAHRHGHLKKITVLSSSMVFERTTAFPTPEGEERRCPPPQSTYGFQKLATEYFARGALQQYRLPFTICRPFNCVGLGEGRALGEADVSSANVRLATSHVVPDLVQKVLKNEDPLHILGNGNQVRCYTYGGDLAQGIRLAMESERAHNEDFNLSSASSTTVLELAELIWRKIHGEAKTFHYVLDPAFEYDVERRVPNVEKARDILGFVAETSLESILDEVIPWIRQQMSTGAV